MLKIYGAQERHDGLLRTGRDKYVLIYGFGKDAEADERGYDYRHRFSHRPTTDEIKHTIIEQIDANTEERILNGFSWNGIAVYLSEENQRNFKAAYDLAYQMQGATLPVKFKLGEDTEGEAVYYTFEDMATFTSFYTSAIAYINQCLTEGWEEKDSINLSNFECDE